MTLGPAVSGLAMFGKPMQGNYSYPAKKGSAMRSLVGQGKANDLLLPGVVWPGFARHSIVWFGKVSLLHFQARLGPSRLGKVQRVQAMHGMAS